MLLLSLFLFVYIDLQVLVLQELYHLSPITLTSYYLCHPAPGLLMDTWSMHVENKSRPSTCLVWAWSVFSQYLQRKRGRVQESTIINLIIHLCLLGFFLLEGEDYGGYKTSTRAKRQSTYGMLEAVHGTVHHTYKQLLKIEIPFPAASAFCVKNMQFLQMTML